MLPKTTGGNDTTPNSLGGVQQALQNLAKALSSLNKISRALTELGESGKSAALTGSALANVGTSLRGMADVLKEIRTTSGDLNLLRLGVLNECIGDIAESVDKLTVNVTDILDGKTLEDDPIDLETGLTSATKDVIYLADAVNSLSGPGAVIFGTTVNVANGTDNLKKLALAFKFLSEVDPSVPFKALSDALTKVVDSIAHLGLSIWL